MILVVSVNPAVDRTCWLDELKTGAVNRFSEVKNVAGGKGVNVAKVLAKLYEAEQNVSNSFDCPGKKVAITGFAGGATGQFIKEVLHGKGIQCAFVETMAQTRVNTNIITKDGSVTELLEPGEVISETEKTQFMERFEELAKKSELVILSGSLPPGVESDFYAKLIKICHSYHKKVILDSSKGALREGMKAKPDYIKPNEKELETLLERSFSKENTEAEIETAAKMLVGQGIDCVVVSRGEKGIIFVEKNNEEEFVVVKKRPPKIKPVNTVGCGDSAVAALAKGLIEQLSQEKLVEHMIEVSVKNALSMESGEI